MTGWRCGWALAPAAVVAACERAAEPLDVERLLDHAEGGRGGADRSAGRASPRCSTNTVSAATNSARGSPASRGSAREAGGRLLPVRRRLGVPSPDGIRTTAELAQALLDESRVAITPGEAFDAPGFLRISYATSLKELERGVDRIDLVRAIHRPAPRDGARNGRAVAGAEPRLQTEAASLRCPSTNVLPLLAEVVGADLRPHRRRVAASLRHRRAEARPARRCSSSPGQHQRSRGGRAPVLRAPRADRAARRRHRLHRRRGPNARRRRALARADEPDSRDRRRRTCSPSSSRT